MEDIINRGGGNLIVKVYNATKDETLDETSEVTVYKDGFTDTVPAGSTIRLQPGESITIQPGLYHSFWGEEGHGTVLVGEVSKVNDDRTDNRFLEETGFKQRPVFVEAHDLNLCINSGFLFKICQDLFLLMIGVSSFLMPIIKLLKASIQRNVRKKRLYAYPARRGCHVCQLRQGPGSGNCRKQCLPGDHPNQAGIPYTKKHCT